MTLGRESVTVLRAGADTTNVFGDPVSGWASATPTVVAGCAVAARTSSEDIESRDTVIVGLTVYLPPGAGVLSTDRLLVRGDTYEVTGESFEWNSALSGYSWGGEVSLTRVSDA